LVPPGTSEEFLEDQKPFKDGLHGSDGTWVMIAAIATSMLTKDQHSDKSHRKKTRRLSRAFGESIPPALGKRSSSSIETVKFE